MPRRRDDERTWTKKQRFYRRLYVRMLKEAQPHLAGKNDGWDIYQRVCKVRDEAVAITERIFELLEIEDGPYIPPLTQPVIYHIQFKRESA